MIAEIRQLLLKPSPENFNKLLDLVRDLDADSVEVQYVKDHLKSWSLGDRRRSAFLHSAYSYLQPDFYNHRMDFLIGEDQQIVRVVTQIVGHETSGRVYPVPVVAREVGRDYVILENSNPCSVRVWVGVHSLQLPTASWKEVLSDVDPEVLYSLK